MTQPKPKVTEESEPLELDEALDFDAVAKKLLKAPPKPQSEVRRPRTPAKRKGG